MNNTFELKRFGLVFKKMLFERYLTLLGVLVLALFASWLIYTITHRIGVNTFSRANTTIDTYQFQSFLMAQMESFSIGLVLGGICWVFLGFNYFSNKEEGYNYLLLPASYFEKWLSVVLLFGLFILFFTLGFRILDLAYIQYLNNSLNNVTNLEAKLFFFKQVKAFSFWVNIGRSFTLAYFVFFNITGLMAMGSLYFNKTAIIKTVFLAIFLDVLFRQLNYSAAKKIFQLDIRTPFYYWGNFVVEKTYDFIAFPHAIEAIYVFIFCVAFPIIFWLIALIRLREKEL